MMGHAKSSQRKSQETEPFVVVVYFVGDDDFYYLKASK